MLSKIHAHPYIAALVAFVTGVVSFVLANAIPMFQNASWAHSNHATFIVSTILWLVIPLLAILSTLGLSVYGLLTRDERNLIKNG
jgi:uncharacterized membrane protein YdcZ (DUF606 family)